jgi:glycosyltransferase involved in cell wall biosynthesis
VVTPRVSFIVPCYNYGRYVAQAVDSLLQQTVRDLEVIVFDDASPDDTAAVLERYRDEPRVRTVRHERNHGHIATYNEGLDMVRGRYVGVLSADDYCLTPDSVARQVEVFERHPGVGMVYTAHAMVYPDGTSHAVRPWPVDRVRPGVEEFRDLMWGNYIQHSGTLLRADVQAALGHYDPRLPQSGDWDLWLRACLTHDAGYVAEPVYAYRMHQSNMQRKGMPPRYQAEQNLLTLDRALALLPADAPPEIRRAARPARQHALLQTAWFDLSQRRPRRAWQGTAYAVRRTPSLALGGELWRFLPRLLLLTAQSARGAGDAPAGRRPGADPARPAAA